MSTLPTRERATIGAAEYVGNFKQGSEEWHAARESGIGSSDIASILGLSSFKSAYTLWHEKVGLVQPATPDERWQRKLDYGHHMEPFVAGIFAKKHPELFVQQTGSWRNLDRPWQLANPDRLLSLSDSPADELTAHSVVELKTFPTLSDWEEGPTPGYLAQLKWQLDVFGFRAGWIAGYANMSGDFVDYQFELDPFEADAVRAKAHMFWLSVGEARILLDEVGWTDGGVDSIRDVLQELAPEIDGSEGTYYTIRQLNPSIPDPKAEAEIPEEIAEQYLAACEHFKWHEADLLKWKGHLLAHMGTAKFAVYDGKKIASRVAPRAGAVPYLKEA